MIKFGINVVLIDIKINGIFFKIFQTISKLGLQEVSQNPQKNVSEVFLNHRSCSPNLTTEMRVVSFCSILNAHSFDVQQNILNV